MPPQRNIQQRNVRDVMIDDLQREIHQLHQRLTRLEQRKVERQQGMQQKRRSHHPTSLNDKEDNSPTFPDPGPLWSSEPIWDSEPKWDSEPNWDDISIQLPHQSQNDLEQDSHRSLMEEDGIYEKDLKPEDIVPDADAQHEDDDEIVIGPPRPPPPSSSEMLDVEEKEEGDMIGPPRPPHGTWDDGLDSELDDLPLNDKLRIPLSNEIVLKGHSRVVSPLAVDHSGLRVFSGSYEYIVRIYDVQEMNSKLQSFRQLEPFEGHQVRSLSWSIGKDVSVLQHAIEKDLDSAAWFDVPSEAENAVCEKGGTMRPPPWPSWRSESSL